jgi:hypothetical protein
MPRVRIIPAQPEDAAAVAAFNERMRAAGANYRLTTDRPFRDYAVNDGSPVTLERYFVWVDDILRGGVVVKRLPFWLAENGPAEVAFYGYPVSEGVANPEFGFLGQMIQKFVTQRYPLVYGLGTGGLDLPVARLMVATGWQAQPVPFRFLVFRAAAFLREIEFIRRRHGVVRLLADVAAATGLGALGLGLFRFAQLLTGHRMRTQGFRGEPVNAWGAWADDIWQSARESYALIADRSSATLATLYPDGHPHLRRLRVVNAAGQVAGWAVIIVARQRGSRYFGNLCLGTLVDCLARPGLEVPVVSAALREMEQAGADLAVTNLSAAEFVRACDRVGMLSGPSNFFLFLSPDLRKRLAQGIAAGRSPFFTRGDGDGPIHLA